MRQHLVDYVTQTFTLAGQTPQQAADSAQTVLRIETALAKASMDRTARRDPKNRDHKMTREEAVALGPNFYLNRYFAAVGAPNFTQLNVTNPDFFKQVNGVLESESLDSLKTYVSWHVLNAASHPGFRSPSSKPISSSSRTLPARRKCRRAGSAASTSPIANWARPSDRNTST